MKADKTRSRFLNKKIDMLTPKDEPLTFLARGFEFKGSLNFDGTVRIDGVVTGEVHTEGTLILGEHAVIEGDVTAGTIVCGGKINGDVTASEKVQLFSTAALLGTVKTPLLQIEEGVRFHGNCEAQGFGPEHHSPDFLKSVPQAHKRAPQRGEI